ncbi:MAG: hypothetical protein RL481_462 [Pseudomonadota bacterium]
MSAIGNPSNLWFFGALGELNSVTQSTKGPKRLAL